MATGLGTGLNLGAYPTLSQQNATLTPAPATGANGNTGLLGQTTVPTAPTLAGTWNGTGFDMNAVLQQLQQSQQQANQANVTRYNDLLQSISNTGSQVGGTYGQALGLLDTQGQAAATRIGQQTQQNIAGNQQGLISSGLGNTTIGENLNMQAQQQGEQALQASNEAVAAQKAGVLQNQAGAQMGIGQMTSQGIQSLNQQAPNMQLYSNMITSAAQGQAAQTASAKQAAAITAAQATNNQQTAFSKALGGGGLAPQGNTGGGSGGGGSSSGGGSGGGFNYLGGGGTGGSGGTTPQGSTGNLSSYSGGQASGMGDMGQYPNLSSAAGDVASASGASGAQYFATGTGGVDVSGVPAKPEVTSEDVTGTGAQSGPSSLASSHQTAKNLGNGTVMAPWGEIFDAEAWARMGGTT